MKFSELQKYVLINCYLAHPQARRKEYFFNFYNRDNTIKNRKIVQDIIHNSLESLVRRDLLVAWGKKTSKKWFIEKVQLTIGGGKIARGLVAGRQKKLPIK